jgi:hypothetical protein
MSTIQEGRKHAGGLGTDPEAVRWFASVWAAHDGGHMRSSRINQKAVPLLLPVSVSKLGSHSMRQHGYH